MKHNVINVLLVDDHQIFVDGLIEMFASSSDIRIIEALNNSKRMITALRKENIHVVLLDLNLGKEDGFNLIPLIKENSNARIIILSMYNNKAFVDKSKRLGAHGYMLKNSSKARVEQVLIDVYKGKPEFFKDELIDSSDSYQPQLYADDFLKKNNLSNRETEIIVLISKSFSSKEIAAKLSLSEHTVSTHRKNIKKRMGFKTNSDIIKFAFENGLL